jgi:hypothetical protein
MEETIYNYSEHTNANSDLMTNRDKASLMHFMFGNGELQSCLRYQIEVIYGIAHGSEGMQKWDKDSLVTWELWHQCANDISTRLAIYGDERPITAEDYSKLYSGTEGMVMVHSLMQYAAVKGSWRFKCLCWALFDYYPMQALIDRDLLKYKTALEIAQKTKEQRHNEFDFEELDDMRISLLASIVEDLRNLRK